MSHIHVKIEFEDNREPMELMSLEKRIRDTIAELLVFLKIRFKNIVSLGVND